MICWVLAMEILQGVWKQHLRPRAVVGYGVKIFLPSPPNYVTRSPGLCFVCWFRFPNIPSDDKEFLRFSWNPCYPYSTSGGCKKVEVSWCVYSTIIGYICLLLSGYFDRTLVVRLLHKLLGYLSKVAPKSFKSCPKVAHFTKKLLKSCFLSTQKNQFLQLMKVNLCTSIRIIYFCIFLSTRWHF